MERMFEVSREPPASGSGFPLYALWRDAALRGVLPTALASIPVATIVYVLGELLIELLLHLPVE